MHIIYKVLHKYIHTYIRACIRTYMHNFQPSRSLANMQYCSRQKQILSVCPRGVRCFKELPALPGWKGSAATICSCVAPGFATAEEICGVCCVNNESEERLGDLSDSIVTRNNSGKKNIHDEVNCRCSMFTVASLAVLLIVELRDCVNIRKLLTHQNLKFSYIPMN